MIRATSIATWQQDAACRGPHSTVFYPPTQFERKSDRAERELRAKDICSDCPVMTPCLNFALSTREPHGVWGGLNEVERRALMDDEMAKTG